MPLLVLPSLLGPSCGPCQVMDTIIRALLTNTLEVYGAASLKRIAPARAARRNQLHNYRSIAGLTRILCITLYLVIKRLTRAAIHSQLHNYREGSATNRAESRFGRCEPLCPQLACLVHPRHCMVGGRGIAAALRRFLEPGKWYSIGIYEVQLAPFHCTPPSTKGEDTYHCT
jgi:hypothetical protein